MSVILHASWIATESNIGLLAKALPWTAILAEECHGGWRLSMRGPPSPPPTSRTEDGKKGGHLAVHTLVPRGCRIDKTVHDQSAQTQMLSRVLDVVDVSLLVYQKVSLGLTYAYILSMHA